MEKMRGTLEVFLHTLIFMKIVESFSVIILQFVPSKFAGIDVAVNFMICRPLQEMHKERDVCISVLC